MNTNFFAKCVERTAPLTLILTALLGMSANVFSQTATIATVPVKVNVDAIVTITPPEGLLGAIGDSVVVEANKEATLTITLKGGTFVSHTAQMRGLLLPVAVSHSHGNVLLRLSPQAYSSAEIALYTVSGKRVLNGRGSASQASLKISRSNMAPGVYLLSVKGVDGNSYQTRLSHRGGRLNVNVMFGQENFVVAAPALAKMSAQADDDALWTITAVPTASGYRDTSYTFMPVQGVNKLQTINFKLGFIDPRDGQTYGTVVMPDGKTWMSENLNYVNNSWPHNDVTDSIPVGGGTLGSWCYANADSNCVKYGRLYTWDAACEACPSGWRLPTRDDWGSLAIAAGGTAGTALKASSPAWNGTDAFGFSALPGGYRWDDGNFGYIGSSGYWWTATEDGSVLAYYRNMNSGNADVWVNWNNKSYGFSVRCLRD